MLALTSCQSCPKNNIETELVLTFPIFPNPIDDNGNSIIIFDEATDSVKMPLWYFKKITRYAIYVNETESLYNAYKNDKNKLDR